MKECMVTTVDNPYDPFEQPDEWENFDVSKGYYTNSYLARVARTSIEQSDAEFLREIESACDEICRLNVLGLYRKVSREYQPPD